MPYALISTVAKHNSKIYPQATIIVADAFPCHKLPFMFSTTWKDEKKSSLAEDRARIEDSPDRQGDDAAGRTVAALARRRGASVVELLPRDEDARGRDRRLSSPWRDTRASQLLSPLRVRRRARTLYGQHLRLARRLEPCRPRPRPRSFETHRAGAMLLRTRGESGRRGESAACGDPRRPIHRAALPVPWMRRERASQAAASAAESRSRRTATCLW
jgi:hypothetical protein